MIDTKQLKQSLTEKIKIARESKTKIIETCDHNYQVFKQTIKVDNPNFCATAYFKVKACTKCHAKIVVDYTIL